MENAQINNEIFETKEYKTSRKMYNNQCAFEYLISIMVTDAFLAKLLTNIGISDAVTGIISSFITLAFLVQIISIFLVKKITNTKVTAISFHILGCCLFTFLYVIPFLPVGGSIKSVLVMVCMLGGYFCNYLVNNIIYKWGNSYVHPTKRGVYSAKKEMFSLIAGITFTLIMGFIVDEFEAKGNFEGSFILIATVMFIITMLDFISLMRIKNQKIEKTQSAPLKVVFKETVGNKNFRNVIIMTIMWDVARYTTLGFMGTFKTNDLLLSLGTVQVIAMAANITRLAISLPFGKYSDKHTYVNGMKLGLLIAAVAFAFNIFSSNNTIWCMVVFSILFNASSAGTQQNSYSIAYSYVKSEYIMQAMAIKNSIGGIFGFSASIIAGKILASVQANGNMVFGIHMYGQQLLSLISFVICVVLVLFVHFVISKQKVMIQ